MTKPLPFAIEDEDLKNRKALSAEQSLAPRTELSARDVLVAARKLIEHPANWCQGSTAEMEDGRGTAATNTAACRFCAYGALVRAYGKYENHQPGLTELGSVCPNGQVINFNDYHTHAEVLAAFDKAIELAGVQS